MWRHNDFNTALCSACYHSRVWIHTAGNYLRERGTAEYTRRATERETHQAGLHQLLDFEDSLVPHSFSGDNRLLRDVSPSSGSILIYVTNRKYHVALVAPTNEMETLLNIV